MHAPAALAAAILVASILAGCASVQPTAAQESQPYTEAGQTRAHVSSDSPALLATPSVRVSGGSEPSILADKNGQYIWIGDTSGGYYSDNNGTSWSRMAPLLPGFLFTDGWSLAQDDAGKLYVAALFDNRIDVARSGDGGKSWEQNAPAGTFEGVDRPWIGATGDGNVALFYADAVEVLVTGVLIGPAEHCAHSTDGAVTFTDNLPLVDYPQAGKAFFDGAGNFYYSRSDATLQKFAGKCTAGPSGISMVSSQGVNNMIQGDALGTDVYLAAAADDSGRIILGGSHGGPATELAVSPANLKSNTYATVSAWGNQVAVAWYGSETAGDPNGASFAGDWDVYLAIVTDFWGSPTVTQFKLTDAPMHHGRICMDGQNCASSTRSLLDYFMIDHDKWGGLHVAYVSDVGSPHVEYVHVPPLGSVPPNGGGGPPVTGAVSADFTLSLQGLRVDADASTTTGATRFSWDWGDGEAGDGVTASHTYAQPGTFTITLTATGEGGGSDTHQTDVVVGAGDNQPPKAAFTFSPAAPKPGQNVQFTDQSYDDVGLTVHAWDFGDGAKSVDASPVHKYAGIGTFTVQLKVTDAGGASDTTTKTVVVTTSGTLPPSKTTEQKSPGPSAVMGALGLLSLAFVRRRWP